MMQSRFKIFKVINILTFMNSFRLILFSLFINNIVSDDIIKTSLNLSQAAYCVNISNNWNCMTCDKDNMNNYVIEKKNTRVIVGYNKKFNSFYVSYRGTENIQNWINNLKIVFHYPYHNLPDVGVEKGFYVDFLYSYRNIISVLDHLSKTYDTNKLLITGYSLGSALATLLVFEIQNNVNSKYSIFSLVTFGSPRVGNKEFSSIFRSYNFSSKRITHYYDVVPHTLQEIIGYSHIPQEIWYNEDNSKFKKCNDQYQEDENCSNSCAPIHCNSISDHKNYLNISMGSVGDC